MGYAQRTNMLRWRQEQPPIGLVYGDSAPPKPEPKMLAVKIMAWAYLALNIVMIPVMAFLVWAFWPF
jgi:hypothetical protein